MKKLVLGMILLLCGGLSYADSPRIVAVLMSSCWAPHVQDFKLLQEALAASSYATSVSLIPFTFNGITCGEAAPYIALAVEQLLGAKPDAIVSYGMMGTKELCLRMRENCCSIPTVALGASNKWLRENGFIKTMERPDGFITTVYWEGVSSTPAAKLVLAAYPQVKKVLIPYSLADAPEERTRECAEKLAAFFTSRGIDATAASIPVKADVVQSVAALIPGYDLLMLLRQGLLVEFSAELAKLNILSFCYDSNRDCIPVAPIVCVGGSSTCAKRGMAMITDFLFKGLSPAVTPPEEIIENTLLINRTVVAARGCALADIAAIEAVIAAEPKLIARNVRVVEVA